MSKCKVCKEKFTPQFSSLEPVCQKQSCRETYAIEFYKKQKAAKEKKAKQDWAKEKAVLKEKTKKLSEWKADLQKEINSIIREIDRGWPCISGGKETGQFQAGHLWAVGSHPTIRFHLMNLYAQTAEQNNHKSGNPLGFIEGLKNNFGQEHLDYVISLKGTPEIKLTADDIKERIPIARGILKWLKLQDRKFSLEERIELRKRFNFELNIYK